MRVGAEINFALRRMRHAPAATLIALLALALGIGANTAIFTVINADLLRPLPYPQAEPLVQICRTNKYGNQGWLAPANFADVLKLPGVFSAAAGYVESSFTLLGAGPPQRLPGYLVTPEFFAVLGIRPALGAGFSITDGSPGHTPNVVISDQLWHARYGGDRGLIGRTIDINGATAVVVGILPAGFRFAADADIFAPLVLAKEPQDRGAQVVHAFGRLQAGVSLAIAHARLDALGKRQEKEYPKENAGQSLSAVGLRQWWRGDLRPMLLLLLAAVGAVLLIACANLANLQLARAVTRQHEIAIRLALGAPLRRIAAQVLTESLLLAAVGGAAGCVLAAAALRLLPRFAPAALTSAGALTLDIRVLAFTASAAILTALLFGAAPALYAARVNVQGALRTEGRGAGGATHGRRFRTVLASAEIAMVLPLIAAAALLGNSYTKLRAENPGFNPQHMLTMGLGLAPQRYADSASRTALLARLLPRIRQLPGVRNAAAVYSLPMTLCPDLPATIEGRAFDASNPPDLDWHPISGDTFAAMGIALLRGRAIADADTAQSAPVALINARAAALWWPHASPIGSAIWLGKPLMGPELTDPAPRTIVGVVADVRQQDLAQAARPAVYIPISQVPDSFTHVLGSFFPLTLVVRTAGPPLAPALQIEQAVWSVNPQQPVSDIQAMSDLEALAVAPRRFNLLLVSTFAALALILASIGIYGVMAYNVNCRIQEIGIRMALGADATAVTRMILSEGARLALIGLGAGAIAWMALAHLLTRFLYGVSPGDVAMPAAAAALLLLVALAACAVPAWRGAHLDPLTALRRP